MDTRPIRFYHQGRTVEIDAAAPTRTVLEWLREDRFCTGTKAIRRVTIRRSQGASRSRNVVVEFPSYGAALECYGSPEYVAAMKEREGRSVWDMAITEGYEGPQPA